MRSIVEQLALLWRDERCLHLCLDLALQGIIISFLERIQWRLLTLMRGLRHLAQRLPSIFIELAELRVRIRLRSHRKILRSEQLFDLLRRLHLIAAFKALSQLRQHLFRDLELDGARVLANCERVLRQIVNDHLVLV